MEHPGKRGGGAKDELERDGDDAIGYPDREKDHTVSFWIAYYGVEPGMDMKLGDGIVLPEEVIKGNDYVQVIKNWIVGIAFGKGKGQNYGKNQIE